VHNPLLYHVTFILFKCRYASLYFCTGLEGEDNELLTLEVLHRYVELLDRYFGNVSRAVYRPTENSLRGYFESLTAFLGWKK